MIVTLRQIINAKILQFCFCTFILVWKYQCVGEFTLNAFIDFFNSCNIQHENEHIMTT